MNWLREIFMSRELDKLLTNTKNMERLQSSLKDFKNQADKFDESVDITRDANEPNVAGVIADTAKLVAGTYASAQKRYEIFEAQTEADGLDSQMREEIGRLDKVSPSEAIKKINEGALDKLVEKFESKHSGIKSTTYDKMLNRLKSRLNSKKIQFLTRKEHEIREYKKYLAKNMIGKVGDEIIKTGGVSDDTVASFQSAIEQAAQGNPKIKAELNDAWSRTKVKSIYQHNKNQGRLIEALGTLDTPDAKKYYSEMERASMKEPILRDIREGTYLKRIMTSPSYKMTGDLNAIVAETSKLPVPSVTNFFNSIIAAEKSNLFNKETMTTNPKQVAKALDNIANPKVRDMIQNFVRQRNIDITNNPNKFLIATGGQSYYDNLTPARRLKISGRMTTNTEALSIYGDLATAMTSKDPELAKKIDNYKAVYGEDWGAMKAESYRVAMAAAKLKNAPHSKDDVMTLQAFDDLPMIPLSELANARTDIYNKLGDFEKTHVNGWAEILKDRTSNPEAVEFALKTLARSRALQTTREISKSFSNPQAFNAPAVYKKNFKNELSKLAKGIHERYIKTDTFLGFMDNNSYGRGGTSLFGKKEFMKNEFYSRNFKDFRKKATDKKYLMSVPNLSEETIKLLQDPTVEVQVFEEDEQYKLVGVKSTETSIEEYELRYDDQTAVRSALGSAYTKERDWFDWKRSTKPLGRADMYRMPTASPITKMLEQRDAKSKYTENLVKMTNKYAPKSMSRPEDKTNLSSILLVQAIAESNLQNLTSGAGAKGISQFIESTGKAYGITDYNDPAQMARAQSRYMGDLIVKVEKLIPKLPKELRGKVTRGHVLNVALRQYNGGEVFNSSNTLERAVMGLKSTFPNKKGGDESNNYIIKILGTFGTLTDAQMSWKAKDAPNTSEAKKRNIREQQAAMIELLNLKGVDIRAVKDWLNQPYHVR